MAFLQFLYANLYPIVLAILFIATTLCSLFCLVSKKKAHRLDSEIRVVKVGHSLEMNSLRELMEDVLEELETNKNRNGANHMGLFIDSVLVMNQEIDAVREKITSLGSSSISQ